jgi:perosamine synthetase
VIRESGTDLLIPQKTPNGYVNSYFTFACLFNGEKYGITWQKFRHKYIELGGDGIYAAWQLVYNEPCFKNQKVGWGRAPVAEKLQRNLMQFTCNQSGDEEIQKQCEILKNTLDHFKEMI